MPSVLVCARLGSLNFSDFSFEPFVSVNPISWAVPTTHEGDASEEASRADETIGSEEIELTRKRKAGSSLSEESNHLSDEQKPKLEDAQNGDTST